MRICNTTCPFRPFIPKYYMVRLEYDFRRNDMKIESGTFGMRQDRILSTRTEQAKASLTDRSGAGLSAYSGNTFFYAYSERSTRQYHFTTSDSRTQQYDSFTSGFQDGNAIRSGSYTAAGTERTQTSRSARDSGEPEGLSSLFSQIPANEQIISSAKTALEQFHQELIEHLEAFMDRIRDQLIGMRDSRPQRLIDLTTGAQPGSLWRRQTVTSTTYTETETTSFQTKGTVTTADGRSISFDVRLEMSRTFMQTVNSLSDDTSYILTDPLVLKLDDAPDTIDPQTWFFDLDGDGTKEEIPGLSAGNAFLALDLDGNGSIDDGTELFGTRSGNGFLDLSAYDEDGNGWIDEHDSVFSKLKLFRPGLTGQAQLIDLKEGDIGAIALAAAATPFSYRDEATNALQAVVKQTGLYLHESTGTAGIIQQIDFAAKKER